MSGAAGLDWQAVPIQECGVPDRASGHAGAAALLDRAPQLTTVHQPLAGKGQIAAQLLLQALDGAVPPASRVELPTRLVVRGTTTSPPTNR